MFFMRRIGFCVGLFSCLAAFAQTTETPAKELDISTKDAWVDTTLDLRPGDVLTIGLDRSVRVLKIVGFSERRGDAKAARVLYDDLQKPPE